MKRMKMIVMILKQLYHWINISMKKIDHPCYSILSKISLQRLMLEMKRRMNVYHKIIKIKRLLETQNKLRKSF